MTRPSDDLADLAALLDPYRASGMDLAPEGVAGLLDALAGIALRVVEMEDAVLASVGEMPLRARLQVIVGGRA